MKRTLGALIALLAVVVITGVSATARPLTINLGPCGDGEYAVLIGYPTTAADFIGHDWYVHWCDGTVEFLGFSSTQPNPVRGDGVTIGLVEKAVEWGEKMFVGEPGTTVQPYTIMLTSKTTGQAICQIYHPGGAQIPHMTCQ